MKLYNPIFKKLSLLMDMSTSCGGEFYNLNSQVERGSERGGSLSSHQNVVKLTITALTVGSLSHAGFVLSHCHHHLGSTTFGKKMLLRF